MDKKDDEILSVHSNRMVKVGQQDQPPIFWCTVCSIKLSAPGIARQHLKGHSHTAKLKLLSETNFNKRINVVITNDNLSNAPKHCASDNANDWYKAKTIKVADGNNVVPEKNGVNSQTLNKYCSTCKVTLNSDAQVSQHYNGSKHKSLALQPPNGSKRKSSVLQPPNGSKHMVKKTFANKDFKGEKKALSETKLSTTKWKRDFSSTNKSYPSHKDFNRPKKSNNTVRSGKILDESLPPTTPTKKFLFQGKLREAVNWVKASSTEDEEPFLSIYKEPVHLMDRYQTFSVMSANRKYQERENEYFNNFNEYDARNNSIPYEDENNDRNFDSYDRYDEYGNDISNSHANSYKTHSREEQNGHFASNNTHEKYAHNPYQDSYQTHPMEIQKRNFDSNHAYDDYGDNISHSYKDSYQSYPGEKQNGHFDSNNTQKEYHPRKYSSGTYTITPYGYTWVPS